jgi:hypothetical protein
MRDLRAICSASRNACARATQIRWEFLRSNLDDVLSENHVFLPNHRGIVHR